MWRSYWPGWVCSWSCRAIFLYTVLISFRVWFLVNFGVRLRLNFQYLVCFNELFEIDLLYLFRTACDLNALEHLCHVSYPSILILFQLWSLWIMLFQRALKLHEWFLPKLLPLPLVNILDIPSILHFIFLNISWLPGFLHRSSWYHNLSIWYTFNTLIYLQDLLRTLLKVYSRVTYRW